MRSLCYLFMKTRFLAAAKVAIWHLLISALISVIAAALVFGAWYPFPYRELSGGRELFLWVVAVDVICGPLMTLVLFNPRKSRQELRLDIGLIAVLQISALMYGTWTTWLARPSYLVLEVDRFKVVSAAALEIDALDALPKDMAPSIWGGVKTVALRPPKSVEEKNKVLFESIEMGRDYAVRPEFYVRYEGAAALKSLERARPLETFLQQNPQQRPAAEAIAKNSSGLKIDLKYLPVMGREDWIAILDTHGMVQGFLKGDGFFVAD